MSAPQTLPALDLSVPGVYHGIDIDAYHSGPGISKSGLDLIAKAPTHYYAKYLDPNRPEDDKQTTAQLDGELAHCAILEPDEFSKRFVVGPDVSRATKAWKEFVEAHPGLTAIKPDQYKAAWSQAASVNRLPEIAAALSNGKPEVSAYWIDEETGLLCRCRPDFVHEVGDSGVILVDVKTCGDARPSEFTRQIARMRYHVQNAYYSDGYAIASGLPVLGFLFASVEMEYPYAASAIMLDEDSIEQGRKDYRRALDTYAECLSSGSWPAYGDEVHLTRLPGWAFDDEEEMEISYV